MKTKRNNNYSLYYQATTDKKKLWFIIGVIRAEEYVAFARTLDTKENILEFFVPSDCETHFVSIMTHFKREGLIHSFEKRENRLHPES